MHHTGRECLRVLCLGCKSQRSQTFEIGRQHSLTFNENTPIKEGKNLLLIMCTLDSVMTRKPRLYD